MESAGLESENVADAGINRAALSKSRVSQFGVSGDMMSITTRRVVQARLSTLRSRVARRGPTGFQKSLIKISNQLSRNF